LEFSYCPLCGDRLIKAVRELTEKLVCRSDECEFVNWGNPTPVVLGIVEYGNQFILLNNYDWPEWKYSLVSGFVDTKESPERAIVREIKEELDLAALEPRLIHVSLYERLNQIMITYHAKATGKITLNSENRDYKLLSRDQLGEWEFGLGATSAVKKWLNTAATLTK